MTARHWCFTLNNPTVADFDYLCNCVNKENKIEFIVFQHEQGKEANTPHYQGYVEFSSPVRQSWVKDHLSQKAHLEVRKGTQAEAITYCIKRDTRSSLPDNVWCFGTPGKERQGTRNDIINLRSAVTAFQKLYDIEEENVAAAAKYFNFYKALKQEKEREATYEFRSVKVHILYGKAGAGKSKSILYDENNKRRKNVYSIDCSETTSTTWFDGYHGEDTLLLDDFYGEIKYSFLLKLLDGHQVRLSTKGSFTYANWTTVYITSNKHPKNWFTCGVTPALKRRISSIEHVTEVPGNTRPAHSSILSEAEDNVVEDGDVIIFD